MDISTLQKLRYSYKPKTPDIFKGDIIAVDKEEAKEAGVSDDIKRIFEHTYFLKEKIFKEGKREKKKEIFGVILSGGQAPGGHNVISGLYDALKKDGSDNTLIGFKGGPGGLLDDNSAVLDDEIIDRYRNTGGFDIIGSGRGKIETEEQFEKALEIAKKHGLTSLIIIGGDDSNTNAALLAEYFKKKGSAITVVGCPKTIDGDLKNDQIEASFGFDTATKVYSELVGNIMRDALSARKYWHFIKLMGRSASHITLECALQTQPNVALIGEEVAALSLSLSDVADIITESVVKRAEKGLNFGVVLVPEGIIEFIPEIKTLIKELNEAMAKNENLSKALSVDEKISILKNILTEESFSAFTLLPKEIREQLLLDRDPHGNVQVSRIESEKLLSLIVGEKLKSLKKEGKYNGSYSPLTHFFGYEGRAAFPSNFDADYCYTLGFTAFLLAAAGCTGYIATVKNLSKDVSSWVAGGKPLSSMMNMERRHGENKAVIKKALVELNGKPFLYFKERRETWKTETSYLSPGAIQYFGPGEIADRPTMTLLLEKG